MAMGMARTPLSAMGFLDAPSFTPEPKKVQKPMPRARRNMRKARVRYSGYSGKRTQVQEMARRLRQINRGQLTPANGLYLKGFTVNSHGFGREAWVDQIG